MQRSRRLFACLALATMVLSGPVYGGGELYIGQVRVQDLRHDAHASGALAYELEHPDTAALDAELARWNIRTTLRASALGFELDGYPRDTATQPGTRHMRASFLVDYDEPGVQALRDQVGARYGEQPRPGQLAQFVYVYIDDKNSANGFDIASMVTGSRAGDCTEHAVLLTALLRLYGYPARTVTGLYVSLEAAGMAYGHAWAEYHADGAWHGLDATRTDGVGRQHIPMGVIENETIGYSMGLLNAMQSLHVRQVTIR